MTNLINIYRFIEQLQLDLGNHAEIHLYVKENILVVQIYWVQDHFQYKHVFDTRELHQLKDASAGVALFILDCKIAYSKKKASISF